MKQEVVFNDELFKEECKELDKQNACLTDTDWCLTEEDFYPPSDNRVWKSNVRDISGGDNFAGYCEDFFEMLDEEEYYDN